jgi:hypothetical protein
MCPLVKANVQICNYEVSLLYDRATHQLHGGTARSNPDMGVLTQHIITLAVIARNNHKLKPGHTIDIKQPGEFEYSVTRKNKHEFSVCFHTARN